MHIHGYRFAAAMIAAISLLTIQFPATMLAMTANHTSSAAFFNHPVLVEGNCDSPVPGTTIVGVGTCGDFDGDGRIGTAEDTDGADRIFGTIAAALQAGTGAAAGTGANFNGLILIVRSGRFPESYAPLKAPDPAPANSVRHGLLIGPTNSFPASFGNVTIEAAPGVRAVIDAVLQGDPAGNNTPRQETGTAITVNLPSANRVVLRNLVIRNWSKGIEVQGTSQVTVENCAIENNRDSGLMAIGNSRVTVSNSSFLGNGFRVSGGINNTANPGSAISALNTAEISADSLLIADNVIGISAEGTSVVRMSNLSIYGNTIGIRRVGTTSVLASFLNNKIFGNGTNGVPTATLAQQ
jgi:hypothetical protein